MSQGIERLSGRGFLAEPVTLRDDSARVSLSQILILALAGVLAALAMGLIHMNLKLPGHAILKPLLPIAIGAALVPRRFSGGILAAFAALAAGVLLWGGWGELQLPASTSLLLLGPALDLAARGTHTVGMFLGRLALAGLMTNLLAVVSRVAAAGLGFDVGGGRGFAAMWPWSFFSFLAFGVAAGLIAAAIGCYGRAGKRS